MSHSQSTDAGATWLALRQPDSVPRTLTGSDVPSVWLAAGWYKDTLAAYPDGTNQALKAGPDYSGDPTLIGDTALWPVMVREGQAARDALGSSIDEQVGETTVAAALQDPGVERDIVRQQAAASDKQAELDDTADADLGAFDQTLDVAEPQADVGYARLTLSIAEVTPWNGAPDNGIGWVAELVIEADYAVDGADARISITDSPAGIDGPLPFTVDPDNPQRWTAEARDGEKWLVDDGPVACVLRWGSGSIIIGRMLTSPAMHIRDSQNVRYGLPAGAGASRRL